MFLSTITEPTAPPEGIVVVHIEKRSAKAKWNYLPLMQPFGAITGYAIRITGCEQAHSLNATFTVSSKKRKFLLRDLLPGSKYSVEVAAINSAGIGPFSKSVAFVTKGSK